MSLSVPTNTSLQVRQVDLENPGELSEALQLVNRVFDSFDAPDYSPEGIALFHSFCSPDALRPKLLAQEMRLWVALENEAVVGVLALRNTNHICMFFVDKAHHQQGIGRALYQAACEHLREQGWEFVTVFSSAYALPVYEKLGFVCVAPEQNHKGMTFTPMCAYASTQHERT
ncbi:MAG: GNAT family N-acetyltransferase [Coriobacteriia bacterium]|nr:GNAT family N-acetyltransferase [Coriobacteriia bacterium]